MCTVSFFPLNETDFILTSNRDEAPDRTPLAPEIYAIEHTKTLFPKDKNAGGTWIGASEKNRVLCILNGGFSFHKRKEKYRISRGLIVKELLVCDGLITTIEHMEFQDIEPFTLILIDWNSKLKCYELVWDGEKKHLTVLTNKPHIWSSSSLYSEQMKIERRHWFKTFNKDANLSSKSILEFHKTAGKGNLDYGVIMDRGFVKTTSITQIKKEQNQVQMQFIDLIHNSKSVKTLETLAVLNE